MEDLSAKFKALQLRVTALERVVEPEIEYIQTRRPKLDALIDDMRRDLHNISERQTALDGALGEVRQFFREMRILGTVGWVVMLVVIYVFTRGSVGG